MRLAHCFRLSLAVVLIAAGCSKDKDVEPPAKLVDFPAKLPVKELWSDGVGGGKKQLKLRLGLGSCAGQRAGLCGQSQRRSGRGGAR